MIRRSKRWQVWSTSLILPALITLAGPAWAQGLNEPRDDIGDALKQPLRDLNLIRRPTADILTLAAANPYDTTGLEDCEALSGEIGRLDTVLGPDVDAARKHSIYGAGALAAGAVGNIVQLPFSGVIRRLTGAYGEDQAHRRALLAGMVRRGYLNGVSHAKACGLTFVMVTPVIRTAGPAEVLAPPSADQDTSAIGPEPLLSGRVSSSPEIDKTTG